MDGLNHIRGETMLISPHANTGTCKIPAKLTSSVSRTSLTIDMKLMCLGSVLYKGGIPKLCLSIHVLFNSRGEGVIIMKKECCLKTRVYTYMRLDGCSYKVKNCSCVSFMSNSASTVPSSPSIRFWATEIKSKYKQRL